MNVYLPLLKSLLYVDNLKLSLLSIFKYCYYIFPTILKKGQVFKNVSNFISNIYRLYLT